MKKILKLEHCDYCGSKNIREIPTSPEDWDGKVYDCLDCRKVSTVYPENKILGFFGDYRFLSNFYGVLIVYEGIVYPSVEHAYQAAKSTSDNVRKIIAGMKTASEAKTAGKVLYRPDWHEINLGIMEELIRQKFQRYPFKEWLLATGDMYLEETNTWRDTFWGVCNGVGENHLGKILMKIREEIRK